tara:strand:+ start:478 stop:1344 length:867 start_codon:yes stop_codon:yes gene_type:complete
MKLFTFGDSWAHGCGMFGAESTEEQNQEATKYAWPVHLSKKLNFDLKNYAKSGYGNEQILNKVIDKFSEISKDDITIVMWSDMVRVLNPANPHQSSLNSFSVPTKNPIYQKHIDDGFHQDYIKFLEHYSILTLPTLNDMKSKYLNMILLIQELFKSHGKKLYQVEAFSNYWDTDSRNWYSTMHDYSDGLLTWLRRKIGSSNPLTEFTELVSILENLEEYQDDGVFRHTWNLDSKLNLVDDTFWWFREKCVAQVLPQQKNWAADNSYHHPGKVGHKNIGDLFYDKLKSV